MDFFAFALCLVLITTIGSVLNGMISHRQKLAELRLKGIAKSGSLAPDDLKDIRAQLMELRDTTTRYDMSFDTALQRLESRVAALEQRPAASETISGGVR